MNENEPVVVIFRKWRDNGDILALFPEIPARERGYECDSYEHVGQHGAANCQECIRGTRPALPHEYANLKTELEGAPYHYNLVVRQRATQAMRAKLRAAQKGT